MNIANKTPFEVQQEIYTAIQNGENIDSLKQEVKDHGYHPEGFYFVSQAQQQSIFDGDDLKNYSTSNSSSSGMSTWRVIWLVLSVLVMIFRIARCSSRM